MKRRLIRTGVTSALILAFAFMSIASGSSSSDSTKKIDGGSDDNGKQSEVTADNEKGNLTIEEQVLVDQDDVKITAKSIDEDGFWGVGVKLLIENNSKKDYGIACDALMVNNYMISDLFSSSVTAGMKANETMYLSSSQLSAAGIEKIGQIEIDFRVSDNESYETVIDPDIVTIKKSLYDQMDTTPNDAGKELYNSNGIKIVGKYVDEDSFWGAGILLYIENNTKDSITISCESISVNGFMLTGYLSATVYPGKMSIDDITLLSSELEENDISSIDEVSLSFHIFNSDSYDTIVDTDQITFSTK